MAQRMSCIKRVYNISIIKHVKCKPHVNVCCQLRDDVTEAQRSLITCTVYASQL